MPDTLTVCTNGPKHSGGTKKIKLNKTVGGVLQKFVNLLVVRGTTGSTLVKAKQIEFRNTGGVNYAATVLGSVLCDSDLLVGFYVSRTSLLEEEYPDRILGLGDLVVTVETTGADETGTDSITGEA